MKETNKDIIAMGIIACISITIVSFMIPGAWAMYGGENETIIFNFETDNCTIVLNQTDGINFTFNGNEVLIEPAINFVGEFNITCYDWLTKETETQSSSGSGPAPKDWSAKCGYNKECLYGKQTNETEIVEVEEQEVIEDAPKPIIQEEKEGNYIYLALGILIIMAIFAIWWFNRDPNPVYVYDNYEKEVNENE